MQDNHIEIPGQMGVLTFDDYPFSRMIRPMLTVVNIDVYDMGMQAGMHIISKIKKPNLHMQSYSTFVSIIKRDSTR